MTKLNRTVLVLSTLALVFSGCQGSKSSNKDAASNDSSAPLSANDLSVGVYCDDWQPASGISFEADCEVVIQNNSASSGVIGMTWKFEIPGYECFGYGYPKGADGNPIDLKIDAFDNFTYVSRGHSFLCGSMTFPPDVTELEVFVR